MGAALRDANKGQQNARQQMLVQGLPRGARRRLREVCTLRAAGRVLDVLRQELATARRHGVSIQVQREGQFAMDALRRCAEASKRRRTAARRARKQAPLLTHGCIEQRERKQREEREGERERERERGSEGKRNRGKEGERTQRQRGRKERGRQGAANS